MFKQRVFMNLEVNEESIGSDEQNNEETKKMIVNALSDYDLKITEIEVVTVA